MAVPNGSYRVKLYFRHERPPGRALSHRTGFDVIIENRRVGRSVDTFWVNTPGEVVLTFEGVTVSDAVLSLELLSNFGYIYPPKLCGIAVENLK